MDSPMLPQVDASSILVVDDEWHIVKIVNRWLTAEGYQCDVAQNAEQALTMLQNKQYAMMLSDINMPGVDGIELLSIVRKRFPRVAVIMVSGLGDRQTAIRTLEGGAYGYVVKPLDENELLINVANAMERRRLMLQSEDYQYRLEQEVRARTMQIRRREEEVAVRLVAASEWRDNETGAHVRRIGLYSAAVAAELGWSQQSIDEIRVAASMHDVGKIGVPDAILLKPGRLTDEEFEVIKEHTVIGAAMLGDSQIPLLQMARQIALSHHEKWNGLGYPEGLEGEEIPTVARIVAVVDVYDALVHERLYKPAFPEEQALQILQDDKGSHFDPQIVDAFFRRLDDIHRIRHTFREQPGHPRNLGELKIGRRKHPVIA